MEVIPASTNEPEFELVRIILMMMYKSGVTKYHITREDVEDIQGDYSEFHSLEIQSKDGELFLTVHGEETALKFTN